MMDPTDVEEKEQQARQTARTCRSLMGEGQKDWTLPLEDLLRYCETTIALCREVRYCQKQLRKIC